MQFSEPLGLPYWVSDNEKLARKQNENHANRNNKYRDKTSPSVIRRLAKKYGIETKPMLKDVLTPEVLYALFVEQCMSDSEIASKHNCSIETIKKLRSKYKITSEKRIDKTSEISIEFFHKLYVIYGFTNKQMTDLLGIAPYQFLCLKDKFSKEDHPLSNEIKKRKSATPTKISLKNC